MPRALIEAMRAAVERRPEDEVHGPVPCTSSAFELTLVTDALLRQVVSLDFQERQILMAPQNVAVTRETRHSLKIEWVAPPTIPSFPVCGYSVLISEDDGTPEGGHPEEEMRSFQRKSAERDEAVKEEEEATDRRWNDEQRVEDNTNVYDEDAERDAANEEEHDSRRPGHHKQVRRRPHSTHGSSISRRHARSADRSRQPRPTSAFGSGLGLGTASAAARRSRSAGRVRQNDSSHSASAEDSRSLAKHTLAVAKQHRQSSTGKDNRTGNAPLLRFEAWGLKADTPYRFHIQAVNGTGRGLWVRHDPLKRICISSFARSIDVCLCVSNESRDTTPQCVHLRHESLSGSVMATRMVRVCTTICSFPEGRPNVVLVMWQVCFTGSALAAQSATGTRTGIQRRTAKWAW